jgi:hypothetical protein
MSSVTGMVCITAFSQSSAPGLEGDRVLCDLCIRPAAIGLYLETAPNSCTSSACVPSYGPGVFSLGFVLSPRRVVRLFACIHTYTPHLHVALALVVSVVS